MHQPSQMQSTYKEGQVSLAIYAIDQAQIQSERLAAKTYDVPRTTLQRRRDGIPSRRDCEPNSKKLTNLEEAVIIEHILDLDSRGFAPKLNAVADMANNLLSERAGGKVGIKWPSNFVERTPELKTRFNRKYDYQRAKCEDPEIIKPWFDLVRSTKTKYGI
jgi:helix-turn-helix, Psq domain